MAKGQKYDDQIQEQARALLLSGASVTKTAKALELPESTVRCWLKKFDKETGGQRFAELRAKKKEQFVRNAWANVEKANRLIGKRLTRAERSENELDELIELVQSRPKKELSDTEKAEIVRKLRSLKLEDIGKLSTVLGTLYDKQALASDEATQVLGGDVGIRRFEDFT